LTSSSLLSDHVTSDLDQTVTNTSNNSISSSVNEELKRHNEQLTRVLTDTTKKLRLIVECLADLKNELNNTKTQIQELSVVNDEHMTTINEVLLPAKLNCANSPDQNDVIQLNNELKSVQCELSTKDLLCARLSDEITALKSCIKDLEERQQEIISVSSKEQLTGKKMGLIGSLYRNWQGGSKP